MTMSGRINLGVARALLDQNARVALTKTAEYGLTESRKLVPVEEGTLERSGATSVEGHVAAISYDTSYAVRQHEDMGLRHDAGRTAKFLERPLIASRPTMLKILQTNLSRGMQ